MFFDSNFKNNESIINIQKCFKINVREMDRIISSFPKQQPKHQQIVIMTQKGSSSFLSIILYGPVPDIA